MNGIKYPNTDLLVTQEGELSFFSELDCNQLYIDLQLFASPEDEGRTEEPTHHKERKARLEGRVARSDDLSGSVVVLAGLICLWLTSEYMFTEWKSMLHWIITWISVRPSVDNATVLMYQSIWSFLRICFPIFLITMVVGILINAFQVGLIFAPKKIKPNWKKINFLTNGNFASMFFSSQSMFNLTKSVFKIAVITFVVYNVLYINRIDVFRAIQMDLHDSVLTMMHLSFYVSGTSCFVLFILSIPDFFFQKYQHRQNIKMTRQEIKEERKDVEMDSLLKQRLDKLYRDILRSRMIQEVPKASIVVTNPTHYAVALRYDTTIRDAPFLIAKGKGYLALKIKDIAKKHSVPMVENKVLAQNLYFSVDIGDEISESLYQTVAEALAYVMKADQGMQ